MLRRRVRVRPAGERDPRECAAGEQQRANKDAKEESETPGTPSLDPISVDRYLPHAAADSQLLRGRDSGT